MTSKQPVVAITGGSMGLGYALAQTLLQKGFTVALCARDDSRLMHAAARLSHFGQVIGYTGDVADPDFQRDWVVQIIQDLGRLDAWVNNASVLGDLPMPTVAQTSIHNLQQVFTANTFAPVALLQQALPYLKQQEKGLALSLSSDAAVGGYPGWGVYGASKAALDLLHKTLATEQSETNVFFHTVDPSDMDTAMHHAASPGDEGLASPQVVAEALTPLFDFLLTDSHPAFPSGARLQVQGNHLAIREVR
jgi:NAD(P)-dependent dehydrogenase (short-subunit alcohol dehydrogenase family)